MGAVGILSAVAGGAFTSSWTQSRQDDVLLLRQARTEVTEVSSLREGLRADVLAVSAGIKPPDELRSVMLDFHSALDTLTALRVPDNERVTVDGVAKQGRIFADTAITALGTMQTEGADLPLKNIEAADAEAAATFDAATASLDLEAESQTRDWTLARRIASVLLVGMVSAVLGSVMYLSYRVLRATLESVHKVRLVAEKLTGGDMQARVEVEHQDEIGALGTALNDMADGLNRLVEELEAEATRDNFGRQLTDALGMADDEAAIYEVVSRALASVDGDAPMEMLLSDSSEAHLRVVAEHPVGQGPGCGVGSPWSCVAVRRNQQVHFPDSTALDACPMLRDRPAGACSAVCTPISFTGRSIGVLHATGPVEAPVSPGYVQKLETLASQAGARIGTLRVFARTELQATTDGLTGLINRRTFEERARKLLTDNTEFALAMCDLDHFKKLNDTYGHEAGDRALRLFGKVVRDSVRDGDIVARYGGEEFVVILPDVDDRHAREILERLQTKIAASQADAGVPPFTISCGVASTSLSRNLEELYRVADVALYQAKETGRNCVVVASEAPPEMDEEEELEVATSTEDFGDIGFAGVVAETDEFLHVFS